VRFLLAALTLLFFSLRDLPKTRWPVVKSGILLGVMNAAAYMLQTMSLQYISPARCAFITGASVVLVPLLAHVWGVEKIRLIDIVAAVVCTVGLYILTGASFHGIGRGDVLVLLCAIALALSIVYLQKASRTHKHYKLLAFYQIAFTVPLPWLLYGVGHRFHFAFSLSAMGAAAIIFCGILATLFPMLWQSQYQKYTTPTQVALIYSLEPVFAGLFSWVLGYEMISRGFLLGALLVLFSSILPLLMGLKRHA
jgi:drug/metabolite transporter (DMT)-like permease